jgi:hypothetical protein
MERRRCSLEETAREGSERLEAMARRAAPEFDGASGAGGCLAQQWRGALGRPMLRRRREVVARPASLPVAWASDPANGETSGWGELAALPDPDALHCSSSRS